MTDIQLLVRAIEGLQDRQTALYSKQERTHDEIQKVHEKVDLLRQAVLQLADAASKR